MKPNEKRSVPIEQEVWREMAQEKLDVGKDIYELVAESWRIYKAKKAGVEFSTGNITGDVPSTPSTTLSISEAVAVIAEVQEHLRVAVGKLERALDSRPLAPANQRLQDLRGEHSPNTGRTPRRPRGPRGGTGAA